MDPAPINSIVWGELGSMLSSLWLVVIFIVLFATNMLLGHNLIPSLVASRHLPDKLQTTRPIFYVLALASFGVAMFFLSQVVDSAGVLRLFWADYWI